jgi:Leucine-rich repeat (LRR) protein
MPLRILHIYNTAISDLTPLEGMPLAILCLTPKNITKGLSILRDMKSLRTIGNDEVRVWPAAEFWERYDKGEFTDADRRAAEYVLSIGGTVRVDGNYKDIRAKGDLSAGAFRLTFVGLLNNDQVTDSGLAAFKDCKNVTVLDLRSTGVTDAGLAYFKDCKNLSVLLLSNSITDAGLAQLKDCKGLTDFDLSGTQVTDAGLAYFKGCESLMFLHLEGANIGDAGLAQFKDYRKLSFLGLGNTHVTDAGLAHLQDCKTLTALQLYGTKVTERGLGHLKSVPLKGLWIGDTGITDLTPLHGMRLEEIRLTPKNITKGLDILRDMKSLKTIGISGDQAWPAAEFWERYDNGEFGKAAAPFTDADVQRIAALPAEQQVEEVRKELKRRNPGFDGKVEHKIEGGVVTEFSMLTDKVTDISPIRVWSALRLLACDGSTTQFKPNGQLEDLTPLEGMNLSDLAGLVLANTKVTDAGMVYFRGCKYLRGLDLSHTKVTDRGLAHFKDCKHLGELYLDHTQVGDTGLASFKECKALNRLGLGGTKVSNAGLVNFKGMPLKVLWIDNTEITDLTPLQGMPLEEIRLTPKNITKGLDTLRGMKSLKTIGIAWKQSWPAAEFWQRYDKGEFKE